MEISLEEKQEIKELINLLYNNRISQYGKRKLENYIKKLQKENKELSEKMVDKICKGIEEEVLEEYREKIKNLQKELDKKDICLKACEDNLIKERQLRIKQDKVIDLMVRELSLPGISIERLDLYSKVSPDKHIWDLIKEYFYKKVEE